MAFDQKDRELVINLYLKYKELPRVADKFLIRRGIPIAPETIRNIVKKAGVYTPAKRGGVRYVLGGGRGTLTKGEIEEIVRLHDRCDGDLMAAVELSRRESVYRPRIGYKKDTIRDYWQCRHLRVKRANRERSRYFYCHPPEMM